MSQADKMTAEEVWPLSPALLPQGPLQTPSVALRTPGLRGGGCAPAPRGRGQHPSGPAPPSAASLAPGTPKRRDKTEARWSSVPVIHPRAAALGVLLPFLWGLGLTPSKTCAQVDQMLQFATIDAAGNLDYKALSYVLTHGEEKD